MTVPPATPVSLPFVVAVFITRADVPLAVMTALILMSRAAVRVSVFALHETASFTKMSPLPAVPPPELRMVTSVVPRLVESVAPVMSPPLAAMV